MGDSRVMDDDEDFDLFCLAVQGNSQWRVDYLSWCFFGGLTKGSLIQMEPKKKV